MNRRSKILALVLLVAAAASIAAFEYARTARPDGEFIVLGATRVLDATAAPSNPPGHGLDAGPSISNAFVEPGSRGPSVAGRYEWTGTAYGEDGTLQMRSAVFRPGDWVEVHQDLVARVVHDAIGGEALRYGVYVRGARSADGSQWLFTPIVHGSGRGGSFTVRTSLDYLPDRDRLALTLDESFTGAGTLRYRVAFEVAADGALTLAED